MAYVINYNITGTEFEVQTNENLTDLIAYLDEHWTISIIAAAIYVLVIFGGQQLMRAYGRFNLTYSLVAWNAFLAIFSVIGTYRMAPNLHYAITHQTFHESVCSAEWTQIPVLRVWTTLFSLSKIIELGDTVFIVLRKQPLILLHWYHHITVLIYTWYSYSDRTSSGRWYITMNYAVHSTMYTYYAFRALKYRAPEWIKMFITLFQLSQMVVGVYIAVYVYGLKQNGKACGVTDENMRLSFLMYLSYFLLFVKFFYDAYIAPAKRLPTSNDTHVHVSKRHHTSNGHTSNGHMSNGHTHASNGHVESKKLA